MPQFGGASEKCSVCSKTVYLAEKIVVEDKEDKKTFHKSCLKCTHCKATLSLGNYASMNGVMYCKPHFKQLFATKGNYDEGFGKEKLTSKWTPNAPSATPAGNSFVPVDKVEDAKPAEKKETPSSIASRFQRSTLNSEKCEKCSKTVYATEKIVIEEKEGKKVYHKACLRCTHCQVVLTLGNYAAMNGVTYCKPHLKQLFATKGNYDEGFGKERHTTKWEPQAAGTPATFVPVEKNDISKENKPAASSDVANKFKNISASDKCDKCGKTVYLTEKVVVEDKEEKKLFHKSCLRCTHCQVVLSLGNYASMDGVTYCKPHFKQLFAAKGNYDEGFGKEKHTAKWNEHEGDDEEPRHEEPRHEEPRHEEPRHEEPRHAEPREEPRHEEPRHEEPRHEEPRHEEEVRHEEEHHHEEVRHEEEHHHEEVRHEEEIHHEEVRHEDEVHHEEERHIDEEPHHHDEEEHHHHHEEEPHHHHEEHHHEEEEHDVEEEEARDE